MQGFIPLHFFLYIEVLILTNFYEGITGLFSEVESVFSSMKTKYPDEVKCRQGCDDCCHAFFDVSLAEAVLIKDALSKLSPDALNALTIRAERAQSECRAIENKLAGENCTPSKKEISTLRVRCPMLENDSTCAVYNQRPVTCRVYGLPTSIEGKGHVCGFSGFDMGNAYPTIKLDMINNYLLDLSRIAVNEFSLNGQPEKRHLIYKIILTKESI